MAERKGFEPLRGSYPPTGFQDRTLKPLGYLSIRFQMEDIISRQTQCPPAGAEREIRTLAVFITPYSLSRGAPSTSWVFLQAELKIVAQIY